MNNNRSTPLFYVQAIAGTIFKALLRLLTLSGSAIKSTNTKTAPAKGTGKVGSAAPDASGRESSPEFDPSVELDPTRPVRL